MISNVKHLIKISASIYEVDVGDNIFFTHTSSSEDSWSTFMPSERLPLNLSSSLPCLLLLSRSRDVERRYCLSLPYLSLSPDLQGIDDKKG